MPAKLLLSLTFFAGAFAQSKPNLIFIMADDPYGDLGCFGQKTDQDPASRPNGQRRDEVRPVLPGSTVCAHREASHIGHTWAHSRP